MGFAYYSSRFLAKKVKPPTTFDEELLVAKINSFSNFVPNFNSFDKQPPGNSRHICGLKLSKKSHVTIFSTVCGWSIECEDVTLQKVRKISLPQIVQTKVNHFEFNSDIALHYQSSNN